MLHVHCEPFICIIMHFKIISLNINVFFFFTSYYIQELTLIVHATILGEKNPQILR